MNLRDCVTEKEYGQTSGEGMRDNQVRTIGDYFFSGFEVERKDNLGNYVFKDELYFSHV